MLLLLLLCHYIVLIYFYILWTTVSSNLFNANLSLLCSPRSILAAQQILLSGSFTGSSARLNLWFAVLLNHIILWFIRYDPYNKIFSREFYDFDRLHSNRQLAISQASKAQIFGVVLGTLGRQGSPKVLQVREIWVCNCNKFYLLSCN